MAENPRLVEILGQLVSYPTVTGTALAVYDCLQFAEQILQSCGMQIHKHHSGGFESLVATTTNTKRPKLLLQAHIDVVPADKSMFTMRRDNGRLEGRGVFDMAITGKSKLPQREDGLYARLRMEKQLTAPGRGKAKMR
jgi:acetylornithine deacetylase/succinyl-diaminopimelate desuccinylase-like protein